MRKNKFIGMVTAFVVTATMLTGCGLAASDNSQSIEESKDTLAEQTTVETTTSSEAAEQTVTATEATENVASATDVVAESGKTLVVYYSASGTTKRVATAIADAAGADLYEITPVEPYTSDDLNWTDSNSRVSREHDDESLRDVALTEITPADWDSYDTVLIGA